MKRGQKSADGASKRRQKPGFKRGPNLRTAEDVRRFLANLLRRATTGEGGRDGVAAAYKLAMVSSFLLRAIEASDIERRLVELEQREGIRQEAGKSKYSAKDGSL